MKLKIVRTKKEELIKEKKLIVSALSSKYILNNLLNPNSDESIFNKTLIFYDLETNGFLPNAYVHQIAALEYDLKPQIEKIFRGEDPGLTPSAKKGVIIKAKFDLKDFKKQDEGILESRKAFYEEFYQRPKGAVDKVTRDTVLKYLSKRGYSKKSQKFEWKVNFEINHKTLPIIIGAHISRNEQERKKIFDLINKYVSFLLQDEKELTNTIEKYYSETLSQTGLKYPKEKGAEANEFFKNLFLLINSLTNAPYYYGSKSERKRYKTSKELKSLINDLKRNEFAFTYAENKMFTEYDEFPLRKYKSLERGNRPTEKEGLEIFLDYLKSIGNKEYVLLGHNINAFDNKVIVARSKFNKIKGAAINSFMNSKTFDTLPLLRMYVKQLEYYDKLYKEKMESIPEKPKEIADLANKKVETLVEIYPSLKAKLDGLMKLFEETKDYEQTHTADDDCDHLSKVFIGATLDMFRMMSAFDEFSKILDLEVGGEIFGDQEPDWKSLEATVTSKVMEDVENYFDFRISTPTFLKTFPFLDKKKDSPKAVRKNIKAARKEIYKEFASFLLGKKAKENKQFRPKDMLLLDTEDVGKQFVKWFNAQSFTDSVEKSKEYISQVNDGDYRFSALTRAAYFKNIDYLNNLLTQPSVDKNQILNLLYDIMTDDVEIEDDQETEDLDKQQSKMEKFKNKVDALLKANQQITETMRRFKIRILK